MDKSLSYRVDATDDNLSDETTVLGEKTGTVADRNAMARLGKEQLFKVSEHNQPCLRFGVYLNTHG